MYVYVVMGLHDYWEDEGVPCAICATKELAELALATARAENPSLLWKVKKCKVFESEEEIVP